MSVILSKDLPLIRKKYQKEKIIVCSGTFDLTHPGHILFFEDCKNLGGILVVSVGNDAMIKKHKDSQGPILNQYLRLKAVSSLKPVDYSFLDEIVSGNPYANVELIFKKLKPDVYVINKDAFGIPFRRNLSKKYGVKLMILDRWCPPEFENISTSRIVDKIKLL